ncbi:MULTISPECIES: pentapeptide repeat-containing protein [unclassified Streptosporangium]|uniref:pentapeptide repeat-containing protein n=1 Tax=unclassified Streptosporangium TaxID=2632669 RepID=UPI002E2B23D7|nr:MULTISPECIES: pentapeptide repeat-containing protein [unclassified Streptosporangium]
METRTIRRTSVTLPALDEADLIGVPDVTSPDGRGGSVAEFVYVDADLRDLHLADTHLMDGRITGLRTQRTRFRNLRLSSVELSGCDLSSLHWADSKLSRVTFTDCRFMGAVVEDLTLENVLFENCRLDYATFVRLRAAGPVIFSECSLREATFTVADFGAALFDACDLRLTSFDGGKYRDCDLRGNDLSGIRGVGALKQIVIDRPQLLQLAQALAAELDVTYGEDIDDR